MEHGPLSRRERERLWLRLSVRALLAGAVLLLIRYAAPPVLSLAAPFLPALAAAWLLNRPVRWLQRRTGLSRRTASLLVLLVILGVLGAALYGLARLAWTQLRALAENWPALLEEAERALARLERLLPAALRGSGLLRQLGERLARVDLGAALAAAADRAPSLLSSLSGTAVWAVVFLMACWFITGDYPRLRFLAADRLSGDTRAFFAGLRDVFLAAFGGYVKSQLLLSLGVFVLLSAGFFLLGQPYSLLLAAGLAVLDFIPLLGAGIVLLPWAAVCLLTGPWQRGAGLVLLWGVTALFRRVAEPRVLGSRTGLSPILSLAGIYVGMKVGGVPGMVLGPVVLMAGADLSRRGLFAPWLSDLRLACRDVRRLLE